jgi:hypothetical protein
MPRLQTERLGERRERSRLLIPPGVRVFEIHRDSAAYRAHLLTPHFKKFFRFAIKRSGVRSPRGPPDFSTTCVDTPSAERRIVYFLSIRRVHAITEGFRRGGSVSKAGYRFRSRGIELPCHKSRG